MDRRKFVKAVGAGTTSLALAGCMGGEESEATEVAGGEGTTAEETQTQTETETETETEDATETEAEETTAGDEEAALEDVTGEVGETPEALEVTNHELYEQESAVGLRGTVENTGDESIAYVEAQVTLQDDEGDILWEFFDESESEDTATLPAGESWQFDVVFEEADDLSAVTSYTINLSTTGFEGGVGNETNETNETDLYGDVTGEVDQQDPNLEITSHQLTREESTTYVTGTIENAGDEEIESVEVSVTLYDDDDNELFNFDDTVEEEEDVQRLAPGESWSFRVEFEDIDMQNVARYVISADSDLV